MSQPGVPRRRISTGCIWGLGFLVPFVGIMYWALFTNGCARVLGLETYALKGDPTHFDPFASLAEIRARAGTGARLTEMQAYYVRSDGTMDLKATYKPAPNATYEFQVPVQGRGDAPPVGAGGGANSVWVQTVHISVYEPGQRRHRTTYSGSSRTSYSYTNEGMEISRSPAEMKPLVPDIGDPNISTQDLWKAALEKGAPKDAVAIINFGSSGYRFSITGANVSITAGMDGKIVN